MAGTNRDLYAGPKVAFLYEYKHRLGLEHSLFILVLSTLLCVLKTTGEVLDPYRLVSLVLKSQFCIKMNTDEGWNPYRLVILAQIMLF